MRQVQRNLATREPLDMQADKGFLYSVSSTGLVGHGNVVVPSVTQILFACQVGYDFLLSNVLRQLGPQS